jgi:sporulation protein YlmC with PRC-barrel domain
MMEKTMARRTSFGLMIAATAMLAVPALAQTQPRDATPGVTAPGVTGPATTTTPPAAVGTTTPANRSATAAPAQATPKYTTSDNQVRLAKMVGANVYNDKNESIGSVDDVLMNEANKATTAILSVGGFLGMGAKLVSVPIDQLKVENDKIVMPGATKASLESMPAYNYHA